MTDGPPVAADFEPLIAAAHRRARDGLIVVAFADWGYREVLLNWLVALDLNGVENYLIVALDAPLFEFLDCRGIPAVLAASSGDLSALWVHRIRVFAALGDAGLHFVHSDVDALWLRDPRSQLQEPETDLVISQGTVWPPDVHRQFGFVLCCGLFGLRANARTQRLLAELTEHVRGTGDDQVSLNRLVAARGMRWEVMPGDAYSMEGAGQRFLCSRSAIRGIGADGLRVALLPHHEFQRVPVSTAGTPCVLHPLTRKEPAAKLAEFERLGCLLLRADWGQIEFDAATIARLRRPVPALREAAGV